MVVKLGVNLLEAKIHQQIQLSKVLQEFYIPFNPILKPQQNHFHQSKTPQWCYYQI
jgi:hypothetical protein